jgi:hypothetical protein
MTLEIGWVVSVSLAGIIGTVGILSIMNILVGKSETKIRIWLIYCDTNYRQRTKTLKKLHQTNSGKQKELPPSG